MNIFTSTWIGQVTTGHGFMVLVPTLLAVTSGTMSWTVAIPLLVAAVVGLVWPENAGLKDAAQTTATDMEKIYAAYQNNVVAAVSNAPLPPDPRKTAASAAVLAAIALSLTACAGQTPAQQAAELHVVECIADTAAKIAVVVAQPATVAMDVANAATAIGMQLSADPTCAAAIVSPQVP